MPTARTRCTATSFSSVGRECCRICIVEVATEFALYPIALLGYSYLSFTLGTETSVKSCDVQGVALFRCSIGEEEIHVR